ncbi:MAG: hypothetical protein BAJALOKI1v1_40029 [Promethearchaeota archaeon]|nr:MAG: hypothetical protein BAJALOKI1v1_40029 [Candidatus Lokiarchaeota archaeon]
MTELLKKKKLNTSKTIKSKTPLKLSKKKKPQNPFAKAMKKPKKISQVGTITLIVLGIALIPGTIFLNSFIDEEIAKGIGEQTLVPTPLDSNYFTFVTNDYPGAPEEYKTYYLWNLTNPDAFLSGSEPPVYEEIGPFRFKYLKYKYDISYNLISSTVTYKEYEKYVQVGGENISEVYITNVNPAFLGGVAMAGGSQRDYCEMNLPYVLSQVKETFESIFTESMDTQLNDEEWIEQSQRDILSECETLGASEISSKTVADIFFDCIEISDLQFFLEQGMPDWEEVFYAEWANDSAPQFNGDYNYLANQVDYTGGGIEVLLAAGIEDLMVQTLLDEDIQRVQNALISKQIAEMVDESGSLNGLGVDIDGTLAGTAIPPEADLNITNTEYVQIEDYEEEFWEWVWLIIPLHIGTKMDLDQYNIVGETGITYDQCVALWNKSDPLSLTGMDYEENQLWFDALDNTPEGEYARGNLTAYFGITSDQLAKILEWIDTSIETWLPNAVAYQSNEWNSGVITNRTVEEWLFEATDEAVCSFMEYYEKDTSIGRVHLFDNCENQTIAEEEAYIKTITMTTGHTNEQLARQVVAYDGKSTINLWQHSEPLMGSLGMYNPGKATELVPPKIFNPDLMRVIDLVYLGPTSVYGVQLNRFTFAPKTFSPNKNYYMNTQGLINVQAVEKFRGVPVLVSKPHFLDADPQVVASINGTHPDRMAHDTFIDIEPISGVTMHARERIQVNFNLTSEEYFTSDINTTTMPIVWYERSGIVPLHLAERFTNEVYPAQTAQAYILPGGITLGVILGIAGGAGTMNHEVKKSIIKKRLQPKSKQNLKGNLGSVKEKLGYTLPESKTLKKKNLKSKKPIKKMKSKKSNTKK